ncbi:MAG TPA: hypothetical protein VFA04_18680 [Bryobacteraceae bacterium]|nr:hypothetical protein [Bryobacteraceae bacterium]
MAAALIASTAAQPLDPAALLHDATDKVETAAAHLDDFACIETLQRRVYRRQDLISRPNAAVIPTTPGPHDMLIWSDQLRMEVALLHGEQLFSWPGDTAFRYRDAGELAGGGAASAGEFGAFGISVLLSDADPMALRFRGLSDSGLAEYTYSVPRSSSHFTVESGSHEEMKAAYEGSFFIDPRTADLKRLIVRVVHPPPDSDIAAGEIVIEYGPQSLGQVTAWLPRTSTMRMLNNRGDLVVNGSDYGQCRKFGAESTISFDSSKPASSAPQPLPADPLPFGLVLHTAIQTAIDAGRTFAGDPIEVRVLKRITRGGQVLVPAGARVSGRIVELRQVFQPTPGVILAIRFDHIEMNGTSRPISLAALGPLGTGVPLPPRGGPERAAIITIAGSTRLHIPAGDKWDWQTR